MNQHPEVRRKKKVRRGVRVTSPGRIIAREREKRALELRKAGASYPDIATQLGWKSHSSAYQAVKRALGRMIQESVGELRATQYERLNTMLMVLWGEVQRGNDAAIGRALQVMDAMNRMMGVDVAQQMEVQHKGAVLVVESSAEEYMLALQRMAGDVDGRNTTDAHRELMKDISGEQAALDSGMPLQEVLGLPQGQPVIEVKEVEQQEAAPVQDVTHVTHTPDTNGSKIVRPSNGKSNGRNGNG